MDVDDGFKRSLQRKLDPPEKARRLFLKRPLDDSRMGWLRIKGEKGRSWF